MLLTVENLVEANRRCVSYMHWNEKTFQYEKGDVPFANGALYLPLSEAGHESIEATGVLSIDVNPALMVVGEYDVFVNEGEDDDQEADWVRRDDGFAIQFFSKVYPGSLSGYETFNTFEELTGYLDALGVDVASDRWVGAERAW